MCSVSYKFDSGLAEQFMWILACARFFCSPCTSARHSIGLLEYALLTTKKHLDDVPLCCFPGISSQGLVQCFTGKDMHKNGCSFPTRRNRSEMDCCDTGHDSQGYFVGYRRELRSVLHVALQCQPDRYATVFSSGFVVTRVHSWLTFCRCFDAYAEEPGTR